MSQIQKSLFCRISKVDEEKRTVTGIGASEALDGDGEIFDYASSKPYIEAWSESAQKRSKGKSFGNIREMHQLSAVGKLAEPLIFDDDQHLVVLTAYISDDAAWNKCQDGTYTGFSIAGPVIGEKWADANIQGAKRYTCAPVEFSVCDLPCNPEATFTAVKTGGITEERKFKAAKAAETEAPVAKESIKKSLGQVGELAQLIQYLQWLQNDTSSERDYEGDDSPIPDRLKSWIAEGADILVDLAREESSEAVSAMKAAFANFKSQPVVAKKGKGFQKDPIAKAQKAIGSIGDCLGKTCKCQDIAKCAEKMCAAHADATDAIGAISDAAATNNDADGDGDGNDQKDSGAGKAAGMAQAEPTQQGESPENGAETMDEAQKAQLATAEKNSAEALELARKNNEGMEQIAVAIGKLTDLVASQPVQAKSIQATPVTVVSKAGENTPAADQPAATNDPQTIAKSILAAPKMLTDREVAQLNIGR